MGGKCVGCGENDDLHFHHPNGRNWEPNKKNLLQRMKLYQRDFKAGNLALLCCSCNCSDGQTRSCFAKRFKKQAKKRRARKVKGNRV
jgi:hypothetical protein